MLYICVKVSLTYHNVETRFTHFAMTYKPTVGLRFSAAPFGKWPRRTKLRAMKQAGSVLERVFGLFAAV